ncbi:MAG: DinB family protein [Syntrophomonadaceae bacterium]
MKETMAHEYMEELEAEAVSTRKCLERIPMELASWKPHNKSMTLGDLAFLIAEIPKWITDIVKVSEIDFATYTHFKPKTTAELVKYFEENLLGAKNVLKNASDEDLSETFSLKDNGLLLFSSSKKESVGQTINHLVHHRGQLTVYMRLNDIAVPSIYGPSADEKGF